MLSIYKNTVQQKKLQRIDDFARLSWINAVNPDEKERKTLSELLKIPSDVMEDSFDEYELPRVKMQDNNLIIILRAVIREGDTYRTTPLTIIMNELYIATIALKDISFFEDFITGKVEVFTTQQSNFFIKVCHRIVEYYQLYISTINRNVQLRKKNLDDIKKSDIMILVESEELLNNMVASLAPTINTIKKILNYNYINLYRNDKELISDLLVDGEQVQELGITTLKTIKNIRDGYTTVMSINLNRIIEFLTYITAIFTVPMVVSSIYGMNVGLPLAEKPYAFWIIELLSIGLIGVAVAVFMRIRKKL